MLVKGMASRNLVEAHIMVTLLVGSLNAGMGLRGAYSNFLFWLPFDKCDKSCKILQHSAGFEANRNVWLSFYRFY